MTKTKLVYLASPYTHKDPTIMHKRFEDVCRVHANLINKHLSEYTFIGPIAMSHPVAQYGDIPTDWDFWQTHDKAIILRCDELWVVPLDGWKESKGVQAEIAYAELLEIPVRYIAEPLTHLHIVG